MKKIIIPVLIITCFSGKVADAQMMGRPGMGYHRYPRQKRSPRQTFNKFEPSLNLSVGYGFPNVDKEQLVNFQNYYKGNYSQTGPITGAIDYRWGIRVNFEMHQFNTLLFLLPFDHLLNFE